MNTYIQSRPPRARRGSIIAMLLAVALLVLAGCGSKSSGGSTGSTGSSSSSAASTGTASTGAGSTGSSSSSSSSAVGTVSNTKVKFILHAGLAFGAFHHFIYGPAKAGQLTHPLTHKLTFIKAAAAAAFTYHELKLALADAQADPTLSKLTGAISSLAGKLAALPGQIKGGHIDTAALTQNNADITSLESQAQGLGASIKEQVPATP